MAAAGECGGKDLGLMGGYMDTRLDIVYDLAKAVDTRVWRRRSGVERQLLPF
jgi:hypothetical protein